MTKSPKFRLLDFKVTNESVGRGKPKEFVIQMFGLDQKGKSASILVKGFEPFFYVKVGDNWNDGNAYAFLKEINQELAAQELSDKFKKWQRGTIQKIFPVPEKEDTVQKYSARHSGDYRAYHSKAITSCRLVKRHKLYGFDDHALHNFVALTFKNTPALNKVKGFWYDRVYDGESIFGYRQILKTHMFQGYRTELYEAKLPPLLRFFHMQNISPSGWVMLPYRKYHTIKRKKTLCDFEYQIKASDIVPLPNKEDAVPIKICSFDIEASSSHGDFPVPIKTYKKLAAEIVTHWNRNSAEIRKLTRPERLKLLHNLILTAFGYGEADNISCVYPKEEVKRDDVDEDIDSLSQSRLHALIRKRQKNRDPRAHNDHDDVELYGDKQKWDLYVKKRNKKGEDYKLLDCLADTIDAAKKVEIIDQAMTLILPPLEGDKVTFIGSTFMTVGETAPYLNHGICLNDCDVFEMADSDVEIVSCGDECDVLTEWAEVIRREKPDVIIGYNIFGFDYKFLCDRAYENGCFDEFSELGRNRGERCRKMNKELKIASGAHQLTYMKIDGVIQIDLYNYFRREVNLGSYKLQDVASHFIGDMVSEVVPEGKIATIMSKNLMGLQEGNFVIFEIVGHSKDPYEGGRKFRVEDLNESKGQFRVIGDIVIPKGKKLRWGLGKDDVTPQDLFRLANGSSKDRAVIAKYCFQDCNLVHHLLRKNDVLTGMTEVASICSIPIDFVVMRGQGIKLLSFIAKKCREKWTLMPVIQKIDNDGSYEGAICLQPKRGFYTKDPVAVVDYASLYPSSMISENISHDSKVWTKEYDLDGKLLKETGDSKYDDLDEYRYVDIEYDTYEWIAPPGRKKEEKVKVGTKICRFAQFPDNKKAIMPSILQELLAARKATRKLIKYKTVTLKTGSDPVVGLVKSNGDIFEITTEKAGKLAVPKDAVESITDTYNDFMKNVFNQRQLGYKITANSLYGQCGARTSAFYDKDIAASTTASGRKLLLYGQRVIEDVYGDTTCETKHGLVKCNAECIYGDSVTGDTPILLKNVETDEILFKQIDDIFTVGTEYPGFKLGDESPRRDKEQSPVDNYLVYTSSGWSKIRRVIRHRVDKKLYRITTHTGMVDVTEDHSLLDTDHNIIKPVDATIGQHLLHRYPSFEKSDLTLEDILSYIKTFGPQSIEEKKAFIYGFFYGDGSCGTYDCPSGKKSSWALNNKDIDLCVILQSLLFEIYNQPFQILDTVKSSGVYKIVPAHRTVKKYVEEYRPQFYNKDRYKVVPVKILNAAYDVRLAYFAGYYTADGAKCKNNPTQNIKMSNKGKIGSAGLFYLAKSLGLNVSINTRKDKLNIVNLSCTSRSFRKHPHVLKKVECIGSSGGDYVYDIETQTGDFNAGFPLIVKNTDSVFFTFHAKDMEGNKITGKKALEITIELAIEAGKLASKFLKPPHDLEYEKTFYPFLLLSKKRYVGMLYEMNPNKSKRKSMGIVLKRRDNADIVKDIYGGNIDILMKDGNVAEALAFTKQFLQDIVDGKVDMKKLIISKALRGWYKNPNSIAHKVLAERMGKRDPGNKPAVGSRIPFVYFQTKNKVKLQGDKIEHPDFMRKHNLKPDYTYYITNQIMKPLIQVYALVLEQIPQFKGKIGGFRRRLRMLNRKYKDDPIKRDREEDKLRNSEVRKLIFDPSLRQAKNMKIGQRTIQSFF